VEEFEYEDESIGKASYTQYKYIIKIPLKEKYKIKNYIIDKNALIIKLERG